MFGFLFYYDKLGNIDEVIQQGTNGFTRHYEYNTNKNTLAEINEGDPSFTLIQDFTYDVCGNTLTTNRNRYYVWNHSDQLLCYYNDAGGGPTVFTQYDYARQERVSKIVRTGTAYERTIYIDGIFEYVTLGTLGVIDYEKNYVHIMDDASTGSAQAHRIAEVRIRPGTAFPGDITDNVTYILEDQIGSSVTRLSTSGTVIDEEEYYPFGDSSLRTFTYKRYRYVGKERDSESGLYYYGARYYAAWTCRFISVDPLARKYAQLSPYNYADNNPINDFDIDGMQDSNTQGTPQGGNVPAAGTNAGATPKSEPNPVNYKIPGAELFAKKETVLYKPDRDQLFDALSYKSPTAPNWMSEGELVRQQHLESIKSTDNMAAKLSIWSYYYLPVVATIAGAGGGLRVPSGPSFPIFGMNKMQIVTQRIDFLGLKYNPVRSGINFGLGLNLAKPFQINIGKFTNFTEGIKTIGLGLNDNLGLFKGSGVITYSDGGWQNAGLTKVDWGRASVDNTYFKQSFREAVGKASSIIFDVSNFDPAYPKPGLTNYEFNYITSNTSLLQKTTFIQSNHPVTWNGKSFVK